MSGQGKEMLSDSGRASRFFPVVVPYGWHAGICWLAKGFSKWLYNSFYFRTGFVGFVLSGILECRVHRVNMEWRN